MRREKESAKVRRNNVRKVLIAPFWALLVVVTRGEERAVRAFGPIFSNQLKSTFCVAIRCPRIRETLVGARWMRVG